jgi:hypothetical protein
MAEARGFATATRLPDGRVLEVGGFGNGGDLGGAEIFDPRTGRWSSVGAMATPRGEAAAAPLPGGRVLIAGGQRYTGDFLQSTEVFSPNAAARLTPGGLRVSPTRVSGQSHVSLTYTSPNAAQSVIRLERQARAGGAWTRLPVRIVHADRVGTNRIAVSLIRSGHRLARGTYRLVVGRRSAASAAATVTFTIAS